MRRVATALVIAGLGLAPAMATAGPDDAAALRAAAWLERQPVTGMPGGQQADAIVALRAAGRPPARLRTRLARLARVAPGYATTAGAAAKVSLAASAAGADPSSLRGVDYLRRIRVRYASGRYGVTAFDQALSMLALSAAGRPVPAAARSALRRTRGSGGWGFDLDPSQPDQVDATALIIEAMRAAGVPRKHPGLRKAASWMLRQRNPQGGLAAAGRRGATEANSTAEAIRALRALGRRPPVRTRTALRSLQERSGAVRFTRRAAGSRLLATNDAVVALAGLHLPVSGD
jgi:hypothetical protein